MYILSCADFKSWEKGWKTSYAQTHYLGKKTASLTKAFFTNVNWYSIYLLTKKGVNDYCDNLAGLKLYFKWQVSYYQSSSPLNCIWEHCSMRDTSEQVQFLYCSCSRGMNKGATQNSETSSYILLTAMENFPRSQPSCSHKYKTQGFGTVSWGDTSIPLDSESF